MSYKYKCGSCRWQHNCPNGRWIDAFVNSYQVMPVILHATTPACRDYERADGRRNEYATCGNCPYGAHRLSMSFETQNDLVHCLYETIVHYEEVYPDTPACRHHPLFWAQDEEES